MQEKASPPKQKKQKRPKKITPDYLYNSGLYYLQHYTASKRHFHSVMLNKVKRSIAFHGTPTLEETLPWIDDLVIQFETDGFLNDAAYTRGMVTSLRRRGLAGRAIFMRLKTKGVETALVQQMLTEYDQHNTNTETTGDYAAALTFARRKKLGAHAKEPLDWQDQKAMRRALSAFARAGFSYEIAQKVLSLSDESDIA